MTREIELKKNESEIVAQHYPIPLRIFNGEGGYYVTDEDRTEGPYEKMYLSKKNGVFICGINGLNCEIFTTGKLGITELQLNELGDEFKYFKRLILNMKVEKELKNFPNCKFLGEVYVYRLKKIPHSPYARKDGFARLLIEDTSRHIFQTADGQVFSVNPNKELLPYEKYVKSDTYEELCLRLNSRNIEYSDLPKPLNPYLESLYKNLRFGRVVSTEIISRIFQQLKERLGIEGLRNVDEEIKIKISKNCLVDLKELRDALETTSLDNLKQFSQYENLYRKRGEMLSQGGIDEIEDLIKKLPSTSIFKSYDVTYKDLNFKVFSPESEKTRKALENPELYNWKDGASFIKDKPFYYDEICQIAQRRKSFFTDDFAQEDDSASDI